MKFKFIIFRLIKAIFFIFMKEKSKKEEKNNKATKTKKKSEANKTKTSNYSSPWTKI